MSAFQLKRKTMHVVCNNCFYQTVHIIDENGVIKYQCPRCGSVTVSRILGRRHVQLDVYAPKGQEFINKD